MFQFSEMAGGGAPALRLDRGLARPAIARGFDARIENLRGYRDIDLVTDLGVRIGSREWWRGLVTCAALCWAAFAFAPGLAPLPGAVPASLSDAQWEEARALAITPLAYGADTGRRMAPTDAVEPLMDTPERPSIDLLATLGEGDGFTRVLERAGVGAAEAETVAALVSAAVPLDSIKPGTTLDLTLGRRPNRSVARPLDALSFRADFDLKLALARTAGRLALTRIPIAVDETPLRIEGRVGTSLYRAARAAGAPAKAVETYLRAIAGQINVADIGADDRFDLILQHRRAATGESETGALLYAGLERPRGRSLQLMQWEKDGALQWFEASGVGKPSGMFQRPVPGNVSSSFGMRFHPILGFSRMHKGVDFRAGYGTPILAAANGRVEQAGYGGGFGNMVKLAHAGGLETVYAHMSRIAARIGTMVRQGQVIGYVGATGLATGPHLHYELHRNGVAIDPNAARFTMRAQLAGSDLAAFRARLRSLLGLRAGGEHEAVQSAKADPAVKSRKS